MQIQKYEKNIQTGLFEDRGKKEGLPGRKVYPAIFKLLSAPAATYRKGTAGH
jgi:hypothetical protein